jgi:hypothetical protein
MLDFSFWLIQNNFRDLSVDDRQKYSKDNKILKVLYRPRIARVDEVNIMSRTTVDRMKLLLNDAYD